MSESGQTRVVAVLDDMFFSSKIKQAANQTAVNLEIFKNAEGLIESLTSEAAKFLAKIEKSLYFTWNCQCKLK